MSTKYAFSFATSTARIAAQTGVPPGEEAEDQDTGDVYVRSVAGWIQAITGGAARVALSTDVPGIIQKGEITNKLSGAGTYIPLLGAIVVEITFTNETTVTYPNAGVTAREARIVWNAVGSTDAEKAADALVKSLSPATRDVVKIMNTMIFTAPLSSPYTNMYLFTDAASEAGATKLYYRAVSP